jgi:hypothetical protein
MWLAADGCANVPRDVEYPVVLCGLGRETFLVQPPEEISRDIYERLLPFAGILNWTGISMSEGSDLGLGMAAAALGRHDDADRHFTEYLALCERGAAPAYLARAHFDWSRVLAARGDVEAAREHATTAVTMGEELAMDGTFGVVPRGTQLLASL